MKKIFCLILFAMITVVSFAQQKKLGLTEYVTNTTISIRGNGTSMINGTAFYFVFQTTNGLVPCLITSRHLLTGAETVTFFFVEENSKGLPDYQKTQEITIKKSELVIINHPEDDIDLAMIPLTSILTYFATQKINISYHPINESAIPNDTIVSRLNPVETVYMVGYPAAIRKELNGTALTKKGATATPAFIDYNKKKEFLTDITSYDGASGAPVYIYQINNSDRNDVRMEGQRLLLIGINATTYSKGFKDRFNPDDQRNLPQENISVAIRAEKILGFKKILNGMNNR